MSSVAAFSQPGRTEKLVVVCGRILSEPVLGQARGSHRVVFSYVMESRWIPDPVKALWNVAREMSSQARSALHVFSLQFPVDEVQ